MILEVSQGTKQVIVINLLKDRCQSWMYKTGHLPDITDVNECGDGNKGGCSDVCINEAGSYECSCYPGYTLASDGHTCNGQHISSEVF